VRSIPDRLRLARRLFIQSMEKFGPLATVIHKEPPAFLFSLDRSERLDDICQVLDMRLRSVFNEPLPAKHVDVLLGISAKERRRWSKDGRLPSVGHLSSSRTQRRFTLRVFSVDVIDRLRRDPAKIAKWREDDADESPDSGQGLPTLQNSTQIPAIKI